MGTRYNIAITATDAATAKVRAIKMAFRGLVAPITDTGKSVKALGKEAGVDKLAASLSQVSKQATNVLKSVGAIDPALAGIGITGSLVAVAAFTKNWLNAASATMRFSQTSGVAAGKVQVLEGAAELAGLKAEDMDASLKQLGATLQDARWGRNQGALLLLNRLGLQMKYTKQGAIDQVATLGDLAEAFGPGGKLANVPVQTKALVAQQFGVEALLPMLLRGRKAWDDYYRASAQAKPPISDADLKKADEYRQAIDKIGLSFKNLGNATMISMGDWWKGLGPDFDIAKNTNKNVEDMRKRGFWGHIGDQLGLGNLVGEGEGNYNSVNLGKKGGYKSGHRNLEERSVAQVMAAQKAGEFNAAGKYQITRETLTDAVKNMHLDTSQNFDRGTQDRIFNEYLLKMKRPEIGDYLSGKSNDLHAAVKAAAKEWASIEDPDTGKSHYDGIANNKASVSADSVAAALQAARKKNMATGAPAAGPSKQDQVSQDIPQVWRNGAKQPAGKTDVTATLIIKGLPAGSKAEVADTQGPVKTVLKVESSMPDYNL